MIVVAWILASHRNPTTLETILPTRENLEYNFPKPKLSLGTTTDSRSTRRCDKFRWLHVANCQTAAPNIAPVVRIFCRDRSMHFAREHISFQCFATITVFANDSWPVAAFYLRYLALQKKLGNQKNGLATKATEQTLAHLIFAGQMIQQKILCFASFACNHISHIHFASFSCADGGAESRLNFDRKNTLTQTQQKKLRHFRIHQNRRLFTSQTFENVCIFTLRLIQTFFFCLLRCLFYTFFGNILNFTVDGTSFRLDLEKNRC